MVAKTSLSCGELLDINEASALKTRMQKALQKSSTIDIKVDAIRKVDTAGLQLLLSLSREAAKLGGRVVLKQPSQTLVDSAELLGLSKELGIR